MTSPMPILDQVFDPAGAVRRPPYRNLLHEAWSLVSYRPLPPDPADFPRGEGHCVLIIPAFLMNDAVTGELRRFLEGCGYRAIGWGLGTNWGPTPRLLAGLRRRLAEAQALAGGPVSVIGVSLGGILARDLAYDRPEAIAQVISIVSPVRFPTASTIAGLFRVCAPFYSREIDLARFDQRPPVPSLSIYTRDDGLIPWESCRDADAAEVQGAHLTICRNPAVLRLVAERLASVIGDARDRRAD